MPRKSYAQLISDLRGIGLGVLGTHFVAGTLKSCSSTAPQVAAYLQEIGHTVSSYGGARGYSGHYDLGVLTSDQGWIGVDPTYMQFGCVYETERDEDEHLLAPMVSHFRDILQDPLAAFEILPLKGSRTPAAPLGPAGPGSWSRDGTWAHHWARMADYAQRALEAASGRGRMRRIPYYARLVADGA
jgi:hypothetical protein